MKRTARNSARKPDRPITPQFGLWNDLWGGMWRAQALTAALDLNLFSLIAAGNNTIAKLAASSGASEHGLTVLLDAVTALGYLQKSKSQVYRATPAARDFLVRDKPLFMGDLAQAGKTMMSAWSTLPDAVKKGAPAMPERTAEERAQFFITLVPAIFTQNYLSAKAAVAALPTATRRQIKRILDIGAGAAPWSIAFAAAIRDARVTVADYPQVTAVTRQYTERWNVAAKFDYREGDFHDVDFGAEDFDLIILGHILHGEGAARSKELLERIYRALRGPGLLLIAEFLPNDERTGPEIPMLFGLNMLLANPRAGVFTLREYRDWLRDAGFRKVTTLDVPAFSPLILASK